MDIRNIAIIAHVDHGKTTLVDALLKQSDTKLGRLDTSGLIMDSNELERERGITIFSKNAAVMYHGTKINIIDTPGHADFGGEVERVLNMADGALLLIDAKEGPMPQTRFVLKKALQYGHKIIVVINKIDKKDARIDEVVDQTFDLFVELGATDRQTDFPLVYASGIAGKAGLTPDLAAMTDVIPLFETILKHIPAPSGDPTKQLQILTVTLTPDDFKGKLATGRIVNGTVRKGMIVAHMRRDGSVKQEKISAVMTFDGLARREVEEASAGDIVAIAGITDVGIGETIADIANPAALPTIVIEQPTVKMTFGVNTSPFAGEEGEYCTSRNLRERLYKEIETDVALRVDESSSSDTFVVSGRGELHLAILIETMRREGYELQVSRPEIVTKEEDGKTMEPREEVFIEAREAFMGIVIEKMGKRRGEMKDLKVENGVAHIRFLIPTRGLIGYRSEFLTDTKGTGLLNTLFADYVRMEGAITVNPHGSLIASEPGTTSSYGLENAQGRGTLFVGSGVKVYQGMVVGENAKDEDIEVNVCKEKKQTNMRSSGADFAIQLTPPRILTLEQGIEFIGTDELVEVTPKSLRLRKRILDPTKRKRAEKSEAALTR